MKEIKLIIPDDVAVLSFVIVSNGNGGQTKLKTFAFAATKEEIEMKWDEDIDKPNAT